MGDIDDDVWWVEESPGSLWSHAHFPPIDEAAGTDVDWGLTARIEDGRWRWAINDGSDAVVAQGDGPTREAVERAAAAALVRHARACGWTDEEIVRGVEPNVEIAAMVEAQQSGLVWDDAVGDWRDPHEPG